MPEDFVEMGLSPRKAVRLLLDLVSGRISRALLHELREAVIVPARPWQKR
jgi:hypothetical protein